MFQSLRHCSRFGASFLIATAIAWTGLPAEAGMQISSVSYGQLPEYQDGQQTSVQNEFRALEARLKELEQEVVQLCQGNSIPPARTASHPVISTQDVADDTGKRLEKIEKSVEEIDGKFENVIYNGYSGANMEFEGRIHLD